ncbi:MAG: Holliday junction resolvase RuvX [Candidatus Poribacteria bacterium]|nr:Holliday junction resolvase RuvX [Candidatus Poribacteria bacterium]MDE0505141.1 Holliday junction resolvase RuvX [Candidatus Poribacteria bacterium]
MPIILGLDVGDVRIGVAISDELGFAAHPLCTITRKNRKTDLETICDLINTHGVEEVVIGLPLMLDGEVGVQAEKVQRFANRLKRAARIAVHLRDERLTTVEASEILQEVGKPRKKQRRVIDQVAAVVILDEYLNDCRESIGETPCP